MQPAARRGPTGVNGLFALAVLHHDVLDHLGHRLAGVGADLEERVDIAPGDDGHRVSLGGVQLAHGLDKERVAVALDRIDGDDGLVQALGLLELRQTANELGHAVAGVDDLGGHLEGARAHFLDVREVDAVQHALDVVDHCVQAVAQHGDVLALNGGDERAHEGVGDLVVLLVRSLLDLVHRVHGLLDLGGVEVAHDLVEQARGVAGGLGADGEVIPVERVVFLCHDRSFPILCATAAPKRLQEQQEQLCHHETDEAAAREREYPGEHHVLDHAEVDGREALDRAHAHDGARLDMRGGNRDAGEGGEQDAQGAGEVGGEALVLFEFDHVHAHGLDDLLAAHGGAHAHDHGAEQHEPHGDEHVLHAGLAVAERHAQEQHADEFLTVLRAVHKAHARRAGNLRPFEESVRAPAVRAGKQQGHALADDPTHAKAQGKRQHEAVEHLDPFVHVDAVGAAQRDRRAGEARDQAMAFARGDAKDARAYGVDHDGEERGAQRDERDVGVRAKVDHVGDGRCHARVDVRHDEHAKEVEDGAHDDCGLGWQTTRRDASRDGIGRVGPAVDEDDAQREQDRHGKYWI